MLSFLPNTVKIIVHPDTVVKADVGDTKVFMCVVYGMPLPHITWNQHGVELSNDSHITITEELEHQNGITYVKSVLEICDTQSTDSGEYSCTAVNEVHNDSFRFELEVTAKGGQSSH